MAFQIHMLHRELEVPEITAVRNGVTQNIRKQVCPISEYT
jgi:hypothetical protein